MLLPVRPGMGCLAASAKGRDPAWTMGGSRASQGGYGLSPSLRRIPARFIFYAPVFDDAEATSSAGDDAMTLIAMGALLN